MLCDVGAFRLCRVRHKKDSLQLFQFVHKLVANPYKLYTVSALKSALRLCLTGQDFVVTVVP